MSAPLEIVILAAGQGKRMYSDLPKVLHGLAGKPLLGHVLDTAHMLKPDAIHVVYGHGGEQVRAAFPGTGLVWVHQAEQKGTGHAMAQAMPKIAERATVLVLYGDVPLIRPQTLQELLSAAGDGLALLTAELADPAGYGRILRDPAGRVVRIVESKDAGPDEAAVREVYTGFLAAPAAKLRKWLAGLRNHNAQGEYYLTDIISMAAAERVAITTRAPRDLGEILGVNSKPELAQLERMYQKQQAEKLMQQGVTLRDPARLDVRGELTCGRDVVIDVNVVFEGKVVLQDGVQIGPNNVIRDTTIGAHTQILPSCVIEESVIGSHCRLGPFTRLRPGAEIADHVHLGNFVEIKKSRVGPGSKINHLSYVGDTTVGKDVNIGAGTIVCNYDGANKHPTVIGDKAFIGSNTALVAPLTVGEGATIGAGSVITKDAPAGELTLTRAPQMTKPGWKRPVKKSKDK
ncbi:glucosamine-1-phosphate N-acetyltransferase [Sulfuricaulis limicola]|uniref:Bifunctional protein GlmU n=1 Tax=Sulfuricaulis limicola TaxID=1620215 RepID=A0A1B4XJT1_9GAMM|nr:bifunctional UDP-N-acetylglucosamine diphosphorylase/glucosamine-1-phosphate N-acetyltransferase GlmU [Sulfuricaulis limicola]BAV35062.1 glucosamine-1-phosphate N-acetyltransferase [Sulfuricaulis limicola]